MDYLHQYAYAKYDCQVREYDSGEDISKAGIALRRIVKKWKEEAKEMKKRESSKDSAGNPEQL